MQDTVSVPCWDFFFSTSFVSPATGILLLYFYPRCRPALRPKLSLSIVEAEEPPIHPFPTHSPGVSVLPSLGFPFSHNYLSGEAMRHGGLPSGPLGVSSADETRGPLRLPKTTELSIHGTPDLCTDLPPAKAKPHVIHPSLAG